LSIFNKGVGKVGNILCHKCVFKNDCEITCPALSALINVCNKQDNQQKIALIKEYAKEIGLIKIEVAPDLKELADTLIDALPELMIVKNYNPRIGYLKSYENKQAKSKTVFAECRIIKGIYTAYLPFDFIITFYWPSIFGMTDNQLKILMLHELKHIGITPKGFTLAPHDIEDFSDILTRYGLNWNHLNSDVPDILKDIRK